MTGIQYSENVHHSGNSAEFFRIFKIVNKEPQTATSPWYSTVSTYSNSR